MGETHDERERRRREALEWWNTEVQLSSFARHLTEDARVVASTPALRFASDADAEADRWQRVTKIFGPEAAQALRIDLLIAGQTLFEQPGTRPGAGQRATSSAAVPVVEAAVIPEAPTALPVVSTEAAVSTEAPTAAARSAPATVPPAPPAVRDAVTEQSPLPPPRPRPHVETSTSTSTAPTASDAAASSQRSKAAIDWKRVSRDNMGPLLDASAAPPAPPGGLIGWFEDRAGRMGISVSAGLGMLVVGVSCLAGLLIAVL